MKLGKYEFGHVFNASGARGFHGEGYWHHSLLYPFGLRYTGATLVSKTTTLHPRAGNMKLDGLDRPVSLLPDCIVVKPRAGVVLNAVGLSGPGVEALVDQWLMRMPSAPFVISVMSVAAGFDERLSEMVAVFDKLKHVTCDVRPVRIAIQVNLSCPNAGLDLGHLAREAGCMLNVSVRCGVPVMVKLNALIPIETASVIAEHPGCAALVMSNTIPWGQLSDRIDWRGLFGSDVSPLARYGGGGLSGKPLLPIVVDWIRRARAAGITKPIVGGGGILSRADADRVLDAGASAIELGSVSILRPWRVAGIIRHVNARLGET